MLIRESRALFKKYMYRDGIAIARLILDEGQRVEDVLLCRDCKGLVVRPFFCAKCKALFCQGCALRPEEPICQQCKSERLTDHMPQLYKIMLSKYKVHCRNKHEGCELVLYYENLEEHEDICHYERLGCVYPDCSERVERKAYPTHIRACPLRLLNCQFCFKDFRFQEIEPHYLNCPMKMVQCCGCQRQVLNKFLNEHVEICDEIKLVCERCGLELRKAEISEHNELDCMANVLRQFKEKSIGVIKELKDEIANLQSQIEANERFFDFNCQKCGKVSCEIALKACDLCKMKTCNYCAKDLLKACRACGKFFCPVCFGAALQHKSCLMCGETLIGIGESLFEQGRSQGAVTWAENIEIN